MPAVGAAHLPISCHTHSGDVACAWPMWRPALAEHRRCCAGAREVPRLCPPPDACRAGQRGDRSGHRPDSFGATSSISTAATRSWVPPPACCSHHFGAPGYRKSHAADGQVASCLHEIRGARHGAERRGHQLVHALRRRPVATSWFLGSRSAEGMAVVSHSCFQARDCQPLVSCLCPVSVPRSLHSLFGGSRCSLIDSERRATSRASEVCTIRAQFPSRVAC